MKRAFLCVAIAALGVAAPMMAGTAEAKKPTRVSITLTCDKNTSSSATVLLYKPDHATPLPPAVTLTCSPTKTRDDKTIDLKDTAGFANMDPWTYTKGGGLLGQCAGGVPLPANVTCGERNFGAKLQIH